MTLSFVGDVIQPPVEVTRQASDHQDEWEGATEAAYSLVSGTGPCGPWSGPAWSSRPLAPAGGPVRAASGGGGSATPGGSGGNHIWAKYSGCHPAGLRGYK